VFVSWDRSFQDDRPIPTDQAGFFAAGERDQAPAQGLLLRQPTKLPRAEIEKYDPFRKVYVYGEEQTAADDAAFIFFEIWRFPVYARFYVTAAAYGEGTPNWEWRVPIE
jgi:hypothetical protein